MRIIHALVILAVVPNSLRAQDTIRGNDQEVIESILNDATDAQDVQQLGEELEYLKSHPIDLAQPRYGDLLKIPFVSPMLAESIILFSDTVSIVDIEQLRSVSLMTDVIFNRLLPFVTIDTHRSSRFSFDVASSTIESRSRVEQRLQEAKGYVENKFLSNALSSYERIKISNSHLEAAGIFEKDAGELFNNGFSAGYFAVKDVLFLRHFVFGNFNISSGEGLVFAKNTSVSKGMNTIGQIRRRGNTISPSTSTDEFKYYQGAATLLQFDNVSMMGFYSKRKLPASIDSNNVATSFYSSGIYRTVNDLKYRNRLTEEVIGGDIEYGFNGSASVSMSAMQARYDHFLDRSLFDFRNKKSISAGSLAWEIPLPGVMTFGETATNDLHRFSKAVGLVIPVSRTLALSYHYRSLSKGVVSPFGKPFGERSKSADGEVGNYLGLEIKKKNATFNASIDAFSLPSTRNEFGSVGRETFACISFPVHRKFEMLFQIRNKERSQPDIRLSDDERKQTNYRFAYTYKVTRQFSLSNRIEVVTVSYNPSRSTEKGFLTFVEGVYNDATIGARIKSRYIFFDTQSYDSRLYQYESDVAGNFSNPAMYGKGIRWYIVAGYELFNDFLFSFKYSETKKLNVVVLGSGDDEIAGNMDNQIALQLDFKF